MSIEGGVTVEREDHILRIGLDRPQKYNSYTPRMARQLVAAMTELDEDPSLWVGVLHGHGKHFCAGLDLPLWTKVMSEGSVGKSPDGEVDPVGLGRACRKPIVTAVQGITFTVGIELALAGDIVIAADNCRFSQMEPSRGIHATGGATFRIPARSGWGNAMYHLLTSDEFDAAEAYRIGLVQEVVPVGEQLARAMELAGRIAQQAPLAVQATKASARRWFDHGPEACIAALDPAQAVLMASEDAAEGVASFIERRPARFSGR
ncbi:MAG: crotonase/enoyl-CoA hydratase family protein [Parahaliea sp.]